MKIKEKVLLIEDERTISGLSPVQRMEIPKRVFKKSVSTVTESTTAIRMVISL